MEVSTGFSPDKYKDEDSEIYTDAKVENTTTLKSYVLIIQMHCVLIVHIYRFQLHPPAVITNDVGHAETNQI